MQLFDAGDARFEKRSAVTNHHHRYANLEIADLLERMEQFKGVAMLTTNSRSDLDPAFVCRVECVVEFPLPDAEEWLALWQRVFAANRERHDLDVGRLAQGILLY